ncbi:MAG: class I SAM-dependent methyltransferase [Candidatus Caenarcaniphilales bacterium]|nr:class I SAM-dependent methyltransferase [Candidatus Caenarcaniphilales bacterium]
MNFSEYKLKNKEIYLSCLKEHKSGNLAVNWGSEQSQYKRFQVLFDILPNIRNQSILDVGCGIGHFVDFLNMKDFNGDYCGIDLIDEMINEAKNRNPNKNFQIKNLENIEESSFDLVLMSGIFTNASENILYDILLQAYKISKLAVGFNCLSSWAQNKDENEFYPCPIETLKLCNSITKKLALRHDYLSHDFTIYLYK